MRRALPAIALAASLAACATVEPATPAPGPSGAPAPVAGRDWRFSGDGESARLAYGAEASDDLGLALDCRRGAGRLHLSANGPKGAAPEIRLESGGDMERFAAASEPAGVHDGAFLTAEAAADEPVFQRFRRLGWIAVWHGEVRTPLTAHPEGRPQIERFFAFCG